LVITYRGAVIAVLASRDFYIVLSLFVICTLLYYFGELIDYAGWSSLRRDFFYGVHDVHRLFFLAPIIYAGHSFRVKGALIVTLAALLAFLPRILIVTPYPDPMLRTVIFTVVAGCIGCSAGVIRNQFERRTYLETILTTERDRLLGIFNRMEDGVMIVGPDYRIRFMNPSMTKEFGEGLSSYCYEYLQGFDSPCEQICRLPSVIGGATGRWEYNFLDGRTYDVIASPFVDSDGETCQLAIIRNVTQRKQVELELIKLDRLKSELLSNVSHELRSPLTSIKGIVSSLLQKDIELDDETQEMLLIGVSEETDRLAGLVTKVLDMSKLEAGVWKPEKELCHISDIINEAVERQRWVFKNHIFETDLGSDLPEMNADYDQIRQVLTNLLENAAAYSEEGTKITVKAGARDGMIELSVSDQGSGIPAEDLDNVFNKFYRGAEKRQKPGGTGLGLSVSQAIVQNHGGRIWVESEPGRGSTFHFTLPIALSGSK
jgi:signal transduction histidine kinase